MAGAAFGEDPSCLQCDLACQAQYLGHFTLYTPHFTLHSTLDTRHSTLATPHSTLCTWHSTLDTLHLPLHTLHFTLYIQTLHFTFDTSHSTIPISYPRHYIPHSALHCLYTAHSALHPIPPSTVSTGTVTEEECTKTVEITCFTKVFYVTAFGFVGCSCFSTCGLKRFSVLEGSKSKVLGEPEFAMHNKIESISIGSSISIPFNPQIWGSSNFRS